MTGRLYHVDGELVPAESATVPVRDRGFRYGDGVFETMRVYNGSLFRWPAHADRLERSCDAISLDHGIAREELADRIEATLAANDLREAAVRLTITRGVQPGRLTPAPDVDPTVVVTVASLDRGGTAGHSVWTGPARVALSSTHRPPCEVLPKPAKTLNYLPGIAARAAHQAADEVLLTDETGALAEGTTSNLFVVRDEVVSTPELNGSVLPGVTRSTVLELARESDIPVREERLEPNLLTDAAEVFLTNTTWEVRPVGRLDGTEYELGPVTRQLSELFDEHVESACY